jgi:hypothetical protein
MQAADGAPAFALCMTVRRLHVTKAWQSTTCIPADPEKNNPVYPFSSASSLAINRHLPHA